MRHLLALPLLAASLSAQSFFVPDNNAAAGTCNVIPFGNNSATWLNQKYQQIVTAADLANTPGVITDLAYAPCGTGVRRFDRLRVTMSLVPPNWVLDATFANNLPQPVVVIDRTDTAWTHTANTWNSMGLDTFFFFDGVSDVVIEILTVGNDFSGGAGVHRDTRPRIWASGWAGTEPTVATGSGNAALKVGVYVGTASVTLIGEGCGGLSLDVSGLPQIGGAQLGININNCAPSSPTVLLVGGDNGPPFPVDLSFLGLTSCNLYHDVTVAVQGIANASGLSVFPLGPVPNRPRLVGGRLYTQGVNLNMAAPGSATTSNYARLLLGN